MFDQRVEIDLKRLNENKADRDVQLRVERFAGRVATVNAWILSNATHALVIDALRCESEAGDLASRIESSRRELWGVLVTHGHADHYTGLRVLHERFPKARIMAASQSVKDDIVGCCHWVEAAEPHAGSQNADGSCDPATEFDYARMIKVINNGHLDLPGGGRLEVRVDHFLVEAPHMTTVYVPQSSAFFAADLVYNGVHVRAGPGVARCNIETWIKSLAELKARFANSNITVYPGHGPAGGIELFDAIRCYLLDFLAAADAARTNDEVADRMVRIYPAHEQADGFLLESAAFHGPGA